MTLFLCIFIYFAVCHSYSCLCILTKVHDYVTPICWYLSKSKIVMPFSHYAFDLFLLHFASICKIVNKMLNTCILIFIMTLIFFVSSMRLSDFCFLVFYAWNNFKVILVKLKIKNQLPKLVRP